MNKTFGWRSALRLSFLLLVAFSVIGPLMIAVFGGFKTNGELRISPLGLPVVWHTDFYVDILSSMVFWRFLWNSMYIALATVFMTLIVGTMGAYCFAQIKFIGSRFLFSYIMLGMMFPFATAILPLFVKIRDLGLLDSPWGVILPQTAFGLAFSMMLFRSFFEQLPKELFEAAWVDGCGYIGFFFRFTLPLSLPILSTVAVFVFVSSWNNFLLPLVVLNNQEAYPWTLGVMQYKGAYAAIWPRILAFVTLTLVPAIIFFIAAQKYIVAGLTGGAVKG
jgi:raffinose/stachyose/melibiose transport system permease protein